MPFRCPGCKATFGNDQVAFHYHLNRCAPGILEATVIATEVALDIEEAIGPNENEETTNQSYRCDRTIDMFEQSR